MDKLAEDEPGFWFGYESTSCLDESINISSIAEFHDEIIVGHSFGCGDQPNHVFVFDFCHNFDFID